MPATFRIGDETVTEDFQVVKSGDDWQMHEVGSTIDFTSTRSNTLPMMLNGKALEVDKVTLFPGSYTLSTGSDKIAYGTGKFTVKGSADYLNGSDLTPTLTPEGEQAFVNAVKPPPAPASRRPRSSRRTAPTRSAPALQARQVQHHVEEARRHGPVRPPEAAPGLREPQCRGGAPDLSLVVNANCNSPNGRCEVNTYSFKSAAVDMLKEPLVVTWVD